MLLLACWAWRLRLKRILIWKMMQMILRLKRIMMQMKQFEMTQC